MRRFLFVLALACGLVQPALAQQAFPAKPVTIIVPFGPGGGTDLLVRALATSLSPRLGVPVIVDNVPGAGGTIGVQKLNTGPADGYTVILATGMEYEMQSLANPDAPARTTDLKALGNIGTQPMVLVVRPGLGVKTVEEFVALAKARPGAVSLASVGPGTALHITGLMLQQAAGIQLIDVSYKGAGPILNDLLAGNVDAAVMSLPPVHGFIQEGRLLAIGVSEAARSPFLPNVPALAETAALKGINTMIGYPLFAPKGIAQPALDALTKAAGEALADPQFQQALQKLMVAPARRFAAEEAEAMKASQLAAFRKALAGRAPK